MKLITHYLGLEPSQQIDSEIESAIRELNGSIRVEKAEVVVERSGYRNPPVATRVLIVTPGPDIRSEGRDYTPLAAFKKAWSQVERRSRWKSDQKRRRNKRAPRRSTGEAVR